VGKKVNFLLFRICAVLNLFPPSHLTPPSKPKKKNSLEQQTQKVGIMSVRETNTKKFPLEPNLKNPI
jgi:hypothetical protein